MTIIEKIAAAGVVGCGGAGFPTDLKLGGRIQHLIVNAAECEPVLGTDKYIMRHFSPELVAALQALCGELHIPACTVALKKTYTREIEALRAAITEAGADIRLHTMDSFYPAGDEQTLVYEVTGQVVPPGGIPMAVGTVVDNVGTVLAVYDAIRGVPLTHKYLTVTGEVARPVILRVPVGTPFSQCLALAGGPRLRDYVLVCGGPMMGRYLTAEQAHSGVVTKTTSGLIVLPDRGQAEPPAVRHMLNRAKSACIQCSSCTQMCPRHMLGHPLEPHRIMRRLSAAEDLSGLLDDPVIRSAQLCCECGVCEKYACPMGLEPRRINAMLKKELAGAGIRFQPPQRQWTPDPEREYRKAPTRRVALRLGVENYTHFELDERIDVSPEQVELPLRQHIGPAAVPTVTAGQAVAAGELIARRPEPGKGAAIHASIGGRVLSVDEERIVIAAQ